jgi:hypothetical protein
MSETCDRCGPAVRAVYRVDGNGELYLCGHCTSLLGPALSAQGWTLWPAPPTMLDLLERVPGGIGRN